MCPVTLTAIGTALGISASAGAAGAAAAGTAVAAGTATAGAATAAAGTAVAAAGAGAAGAGAAAGGFSTLQLVGLGLSLASTAVGMLGQRSATKAAIAGAELQRDEELRIAKEIRQSGQEDSDRRRRQGAAVVSEQKARAAAAGIDPTTGSALDLLDDSAYLVEEDAFTIRTNAERNARGHQGNARIHDHNIHSARRTGIFSQAGTLLTGASRVASKWNAYRTSNLAGAY